MKYLKSSKRIPDMIWTDKRSEFYNTHVNLKKKIALNYIQQRMKKKVLLLSNGIERLKIKCEKCFSRVIIQFIITNFTKYFMNIIISFKHKNDTC